MSEKGDMFFHHGGHRPVEAGATVVVTFRDGLESKGARADYWRWKHVGQNDDIMSYRVVKP